MTRLHNQNISKSLSSFKGIAVPFLTHPTFLLQNTFWIENIYNGFLLCFVANHSCPVDFFQYYLTSKIFSTPSSRWVRLMPFVRLSGTYSNVEKWSQISIVNKSNNTYMSSYEDNVLMTDSLFIFIAVFTFCQCPFTVWLFFCN